MPAFDTWESYFYSPPHDRTLRNKEGIQNRVEALAFERTEALARQLELMENPQLVEHTFDAAHVQAIHAHLFQDVYEWAGDFRSQNMQRAGDALGFASVERGEIDLFLKIAQDRIRDNPWASLNKTQFVNEAATVFTSVNQAHPFREGNGRMTKVFLEHVAVQSNFTLDFELVDPELWNHLAAMTRPQHDRLTFAPEAIVPAFVMAAVERPATVASPTAEVSRVHSASYPRSATQATKPGKASTQSKMNRGGTYMPGREYGSGGVGR